MTEKRFELLDETIFDNQEQAEDGGRVTYWVVEYQQRQKLVELLNNLQSIICRDEISIKTMMSNMEKLEEANDNMNLFIKQTIQPLLSDCVFELCTIESMSQVELAKKIENEIIPFIQDFKYIKYEEVEKWVRNDLE